MSERDEPKNVSRKQLLALCENVGASCDFAFDSRRYKNGKRAVEIVCEIAAPMVFDSDGIHGLVVSSWCGEDGPRPVTEEYADMYNRIAYGIGLCSTDDCDICQKARIENEKKGCRNCGIRPRKNFWEFCSMDCKTAFVELDLERTN